MIMFYKERYFKKVNKAEYNDKPSPYILSELHGL